MRVEKTSRQKRGKFFEKMGMTKKVMKNFEVRKIFKSFKSVLNVFRDA